jgi:hypothetical protein
VLSQVFRAISARCQRSSAPIEILIAILLQHRETGSIR